MEEHVQKNGSPSYLDIVRKLITMPIAPDKESVMTFFDYCATLVDKMTESKLWPDVDTQEFLPAFVELYNRCWSTYGTNRATFNFEERIASWILLCRMSLFSYLPRYIERNREKLKEAKEGFSISDYSYGSTSSLNECKKRSLLVTNEPISSYTIHIIWRTLMNICSTANTVRYNTQLKELITLLMVRLGDIVAIADTDPKIFDHQLFVEEISTQEEGSSRLVSAYKANDQFILDCERIMYPFIRRVRHRELFVSIEDNKVRYKSIHPNVLSNIISWMNGWFSSIYRDSIIDSFKYLLYDSYIFLGDIDRHRQFAKNDSDKSIGIIVKYRDKVVIKVAEWLNRKPVETMFKRLTDKVHDLEIRSGKKSSKEENTLEDLSFIDESTRLSNRFLLEGLDDTFDDSDIITNLTSSREEVDIDMPVFLRCLLEAFEETLSGRAKITDFIVYRDKYENYKNLDHFKSERNRYPFMVQTFSDFHVSLPYGRWIFCDDSITCFFEWTKFIAMELDGKLENIDYDFKKLYLLFMGEKTKENVKQTRPPTLASAADELDDETMYKKEVSKVRVVKNIYNETVKVISC